MTFGRAMRRGKYGLGSGQKASIKVRSTDANPRRSYLPPPGTDHIAVPLINLLKS